MDKQILQRYLPSILLIVGIVLVWSARSQSAVPLAGSLQTLLPTYSGFTVKEQTVSAEERKVAGMTDYVARSFWHDTTIAFTTYVGYYDRQTQGKSMHSPRNCLPGAGWEILSTDTALIKMGGQLHVVNKYFLKNGPYQAVVLYWYQGRGRVVASEYAVKWNLLRDAALEGHTEEALVRVVSFVSPDSAVAIASPKQIADAEKLALDVGALLMPQVERVLPKRPAAGAVATTRAELHVGLR